MEILNSSETLEVTPISAKKFFINYGILLLIFTLLFGILFYSVFLSKKAWQNNLKVTVEKVLEEKDPSNWTITSSNKIDNPFSMNAACFDGRNRLNGQVYKVVILRITTLYGPMSAVFTVSDEKEVNFIGYSSVHGRIEEQLENNINNQRINYWKQKIPEIIGMN